MIKNIPGLIEAISGEIKEFTDIAVVGLSGGVDSMLVSILCMKALGPENVYAVHMPYGEVDTDQDRFNARSVKIAEKLGLRSLLAPITAISNAINGEVRQAVFQVLHEGTKLSTVNKGNARSRARMAVLYGISHELGTILKRRIRVIGTGNLSEDFIGYDSKGGDALCDIFPIGELYKSEVYQLADFFVEQGLVDDSMVDRNPSAGLWDGQSDEDELGHTYNVMEKSIRKITTEEWSKDPWNEVDEFVWSRHFANKHKHEAPPVLSLREKFCDGEGFRSELYRSKG